MHVLVRGYTCMHFMGEDARLKWVCTCILTTAECVTCIHVYTHLRRAYSLSACIHEYTHVYPSTPSSSPSLLCMLHWPLHLPWWLWLWTNTPLPYSVHHIVSSLLLSLTLCSWLFFLCITVYLHRDHSHVEICDQVRQFLLSQFIHLLLWVLQLCCQGLHSLPHITEVVRLHHDSFHYWCQSSLDTL